MGTKFQHLMRILVLVIYKGTMDCYPSLTECKLIEEVFKRFTTDEFVLWPQNTGIDVFREVLNELHPSLKFAVEKVKSFYVQNFDALVQALIFLNVSVILH